MHTRVLRYFSTCPISIKAAGNISLSQSESLLFDSLKAALPKTTLRVAGGWVRDKLLGLESKDIDIALDNCKGTEAALIIQKSVKNSSSIGTVKTNPDASKHLETACIHIMDFDVDLVNLRTDTYTDSRIPTIV